MSQNYRELGQDQDLKWNKGVELMNDFANSLERKGLLPKRFEQPNTPETHADVLRFSSETKEKLIKDGAVVYEVPIESITDQQKQKKPFWYVVDAGRVFLSKKSRAMEVAIYPDPEKFFVPDSFRKTKAQQEALLQKDTQALQKRLRVTDIQEILLEAPEATNVIFQHLQKFGVRLLGKTFDYLYMRTNTPTNASGSGVASVGRFHDAYGLNVHDCDAMHGTSSIGAARAVVPVRK